MSVLLPIADPFLNAKLTKASNDEVDIVAALERDLRSEKKQETLNSQSQQLGSSGTQLVDFPGDNEYLKRKAQLYARVDNVPPPSSSVLGDFSNLLGQTSSRAYPNSGLARNQLMAMSYSTMENKSSESERIVESQLTYQLAASDFGLETKSQRAFKDAKKKSKLGNNSMYY